MMSYWTKKVNEFWDEWIGITGQESGDPDEFIEWVTASKKLALRPEDMRQVLRRQVTQALRQAKRFDEEGSFTYRAKQSVTLFNGDTAIKHYFDTDNGGTATLRQRSTRQRREAIAHHVYRAVCDVERMNKRFPDDPQLNFFTNFGDDVAELRAAEWMDRESGEDED
jgi:hypothetical protein